MGIGEQREHHQTEGRAAYVIIIMAIYWMVEVLPLAITSLLPVVLFPLLGIMDTGKVCTAYMKETNMMFIGGLMVALTIEHCNLHKRIALKVMLLVGASPRRLMLGFMFTTMFLSMWISNTATTAMMVPIVEAVVEELFKNNDDEEMERDVHMVPNGSSEASSGDKTIDVDLNSVTCSTDDSVTYVGNSCQQLAVSEIQRDNFSRMRNCCLLSVAYSANIGGTGTLIGSGTNLVLKGVYKESSSSVNDPVYQRKLRTCFLMSIAYASNIGGTGSLIGSSPQLALKGLLNELYGSAPGLNFASWMGFNVPGMLINTFLAWIWLQYIFLGFRRETTDENSKTAVIQRLIRKKYEELGPMTFHELATLILFILCVLLWFFRDPQFIHGWSNYLPVEVEIDDATAVMAIVMFLFIIPAKPQFWSSNVDKENGVHKPSPALLEWKYVQDNLPWGIVLLLGGGFALSDASKISGLSKWLVDQLGGLSSLPPFVVMLIICIMTATITEVASNTATANILLPILSEMAVTVKVNPLYLMLPATVTCSYAFMLPVATPPNAIVFAAGRMNTVDMVKAGFFMNIMCVVVICLMMVSFGGLIFQFDGSLPDWAVPTLPNVTNETMQSFFLNCTI
ncbi:solute carrier family 13 member 5-like isoform X2 [Daphnia pulex]|uniref:solute carrier family 13 member 5-like isoform X2 n=1 Tax=Daphnia pulex TaxID=6669 RepID=UPI001EDD8F29|nr:solute carrier family 13 member 5-like isoform X2 [Daphnia pulex]